MKTVIQELFEDLKSKGVKSVLNNEQYFEDLHKQQIFDAFVSGDNRGGEVPFNCEQYYTQTFKQ